MGKTTELSREYPLFTDENAGKCPTARYVGGTSRYLCECAKPEECEGVRTAREVEKGDPGE